VIGHRYKVGGGTNGPTLPTLAHMGLPPIFHILCGYSTPSDAHRRTGTPWSFHKKAGLETYIKENKQMAKVIWEEVDQEGAVYGNGALCRSKFPGGWIVKLYSRVESNKGLIFLPDPKHKWE
jgi:hypothetical protein